MYENRRDHSREGQVTPQKPSKPTVMTISDAAEKLDVHPRTVRRWINDGDLPARKVSRGKRDVWEIEASDLAAFAESTGRPLTSADSTGGQAVTSAGEESMTQPETAAESADMQRTVENLRTELEDTKRHLADTQARLRAVTDERDFLRETIRNLTTKALPAAAQEATEREESEEQADALREERDRLQERLQAEKSKSWWQRMLE